MTTRIDTMPVYAAQSSQLDAKLYNLWRRARLHLGSPLRLPLAGLREFVLILEDDSWVVVDEGQYDLPILAWIKFQDNHRDNLHMPVPCTLNYYHYMAGSLCSKVLSLMATTLDQRLHDDGLSQDKTGPTPEQ